jgi:hypothetical protein
MQNFADGRFCWCRRGGWRLITGNNKKARSGRITHTTRNIGAPPGWDHDKQGQCAHLAVRDVMTTAGPVTRMQSVWFPKPSEIERIKAGAPLHLTMLGVFHPPVALDVGPTWRLTQPARSILNEVVQNHQGRWHDADLLTRQRCRKEQDVASASRSPPYSPSSPGLAPGARRSRASTPPTRQRVADEVSNAESRMSLRQVRPASQVWSSRRPSRRRPCSREMAPAF